MNYSTLTVWQALSESVAFQVAFSAKDFPRLIGDALIDKVAPEVVVTLEAGLDEWQEKSIQGTLKTTLWLYCQRCLEPFEYPLNLSFRWVPVKSEYEAELIGDEEAVLLLEELDPQDILYHLEDEILLSMPIIPYHDEMSFCSGREFIKNQEAIEEEKQTPFSELVSLLKDNPT